MVKWNSKLYLEFERERTRAAHDLLARITKTPAGGVFDLGCGPGNSTELLCAAFPNADVVGVDISERMVVAARARAEAPATPARAVMSSNLPPPVLRHN